MTQNKTNKAEWEKEFEKFLITWEPLFYDQKVDGKAIRQLKDFISHQRQRLIDQVEKEVIGNNKTIDEFVAIGANREDAELLVRLNNVVKTEQRQKLSALRKEGEK